MPCERSVTGTGKKRDASGFIPAALDDLPPEDLAAASERPSPGALQGRQHRAATGAAAAIRISCTRIFCAAAGVPGPPEEELSMTDSPELEA
jgi:hypothetical protein